MALQGEPQQKPQKKRKRKQWKNKLVEVSIVEGFGNRVFYLMLIIGHFYTHFHLTFWGIVQPFLTRVN